MIQILVCDKLYVTPEMRRKKIVYKIYFILSILLVISLFTYYIYAEYDRAKSEEVSQEILNSLNLQAISSTDTEDEDETVTIEDNVIVVVLNDNSEEEIDVDELIASTEEQIEENESNNSAAIPKLYEASDGTKYYVIAVITIPKLNIQYPVLSTWSNELLKNATCRYAGPEEPNTVGNFCIIGHNYRNSSFFSKLSTLETKDIIQLQDMSGKTVEYMVYDTYVVEPEDLSCTNQNTNGKKEITLITCYDNGKRRTVIKATAID